MGWLTDQFANFYLFQPASRDFLPRDGQMIAPVWYAGLLDITRAYYNSIEVVQELIPQLSESPRPRKADGWGWNIRNVIRDEMNNPADTFGLAEGDDDEWISE